MGWLIIDEQNVQFTVRPGAASNSLLKGMQCKFGPAFTITARARTVRARAIVTFPWNKFLVYLIMGALSLMIAGWLPIDVPDIQACERWVAPEPAGNNSNPGTEQKPWATLAHAATSVPDAGCTVWVKSGIYQGTTDLERRFTMPATFKAVEAYEAILVYSSTVLELDGVRNMVFEGFQFQHSGPESSNYVVILDRRDDIWSENVTFRNNIFHDSYDNDLLKIHNGARFITVENNIFYNQGDSEQHMDVNSVTDIVIQDNIFFNDFAGSGRPISGETKHFIVVKDSNEDHDGHLGSKRITIRRNIFLNWQGNDESFVQVGNDGKPYHEAIGVEVVNNLMIGNSPEVVGSVFGVTGARDVLFANNTVVGDMPSEAHAFRVAIKGENPRNENIVFVNNIWSDPTGTMGKDLTDDSGNFARGDLADTRNLLLKNNLYWNGGEAVPSGDPVSPEDDVQGIFADPLLPAQRETVILPRWTGTRFCSGNDSIRQEFLRLVTLYGQPGVGSAAIDQADPTYAPGDDILRHPRTAPPDVGAYEYLGTGSTGRLLSDTGRVSFLPIVSDAPLSIC